jgi:hypothetical protein
VPARHASVQEGVKIEENRVRTRLLTFENHCLEGRLTFSFPPETLAWRCVHVECHTGVSSDFPCSHHDFVSEGVQI